LALLLLGCSSAAFGAEPLTESSALPPAPRPAQELIVQPGHPKTSNGFHPRIILSDAAGQPVRESGGPIDPMTTCGQCHDVRWIGSHGFHFARPEGVATVIDPRPEPTTTRAPNCFFCHVQQANVTSARAALARGAADWVATATLAGSSLVVSTAMTASASAEASTPPSTTASTPTPPHPSAPYRYERQAIASDGSVSADQLQLGPPSNQACGACHGIVSRHGPALAEWSTQPAMTTHSGQVFSPARVLDTSLNLKDRDQLARSWDVHAERLLNCSDCHFSPNDPRARAMNGSTAAALRFDPRHAGIAAFLRKPSHEFARGQASVSCEHCHQSQNLHAFLPHAQRHLAKLACETCHIPRSLVPALAEVNDAVPAAPGRAARSYRGLRGDIRDPAAYIEGFAPAIALRKTPAGKQRLTPVNWVVSWSWKRELGRGAVVASAALVNALFDAQGNHRAEVIQALDRNGDQRLDESELLPDTDGRVAAVQALLAQAGIADVSLVGEARAYPLHHGVVAGQHAVRACGTCHGAGSRLTTEYELTQRKPASARLVLVEDPELLPSDVSFAPGPHTTTVHVTAPRSANYVLGSSRISLLDTGGLALVALVLLGALSHGALRLRGSWRRKNGKS
jgi:hypothetical protein